MKKLVKDTEDLRTNIQIIHDNFSFYLKKSGMTQKKYSELSGLPESTISKWKHHNSNMNEDHIRQAADIFDITVNDLYYNNIDKKKIKILKDSPYDPIMATQQIEINLMNHSFQRPLIIMCVTIVLSIIIAIIIFFITKYSPFWCLSALCVPFFARIDFKQTFGSKKTFSINYLDDIYYQIKNEKNQYYEASSFMRCIEVLMVLFAMILTLSPTNISSSNSDIVILFGIFSFISFCISGFSMLFYKDKKLKKKIYDNEIDGYISKLVNLYNYSILIVIVSSLLSTDFKNFWYIGLLCFIAFVLSIIEFILISKKYNEYEMVYERFKEEPRKLFPDNYNN